MKKNRRMEWSLPKLPTVEEVLNLVKNKIITKEEAREMLFTEPKSNTTTYSTSTGESVLSYKIES